MDYKPVARSSDLVVQELGDETLVYDLRTHNAKCLNETCSAVWSLCDGSRDSIDISIALSAQFKTTVDQELIWLAIDQLRKEELLEYDDGFVAKMSGTSRRELIKNAGFVAVIALPVVSSVVAPLGAHAQSVIACTPTSGTICECGTSGGNGTPACVDAYNGAGYVSTRTGNEGGPCGTNDVSCVASGCPTGFSKCCVVLTNPNCNGPGNECCVL